MMDEQAEQNVSMVNNTISTSHEDYFKYIINNKQELISITNNCFVVTGYLEEELLYNGNNLFNAKIFLADVDVVRNNRIKCIEDEDPKQFKYRIYTKNGFLKWVEETVSVIKNDSEILLQGLVKEIHQHMNTETLQHFNQAYFDALSQHAMVSITDTQYNLIYVNDYYCNISKYTRNELIGQKHYFSNFKNNSSEFSKPIYDTLIEGKTWHGEIKNKAKDGSAYWVEANIVPIKDSNNEIVQFMAVQNVITDKKEQEKKINLTVEELNEAQLIGKIGSWKRSLINQENVLSPEMFNILELDKDTIINHDQYLELVHPDDRELFSTNWHTTLQGIETDFEHRVILKSGTKWIRAISRVDKDEYGNDIRLHGIIKDITHFKTKELELQETKQELKNILENVPVSILQIDKDFNIFYSNNKEVNIVGENLLQNADEKFIDKLQSKFKEAFHYPQQTISTEAKFKSPKNKYDWYKTIIKKIGNTANDYSYLVIQRNISDEKSFSDKLLASTTQSEENERKRIALELHDGVGQNLITLKLLSEKLSKSFEKETYENNKESFKQIKHLIETTIAEIRKCSYDLMPSSIDDIGLYGSLKELFALNNALGNFRFSLDINATTEPQGYVAVNIYRIVQEFIQNALKHSEGCNLSLRINENKHHLVFKISDDGKGFEQTSDYKAGLGILSMIGRINNIGGTHNIITQTNQGVQLFFSIPIE
ncbi:MAG: PAS domain-containing protein [Chitinophagaceae bacterium]|nr:PAS domain-containing protein [Chitinophagaceae bacterium]